MLLPTPTMPAAVGEEIDNEHADLAAAEKHLITAVTAVDARFLLGISRFKDFAKLERPPTPPSFWAELFKSGAIILLGNLVAPFAGAMLEHLPSVKRALANPELRDH